MEPTNLEIITAYFEDILQRSGDEVSAAEINSYVSAVESGALTLAQARAALINSPEGEAVQDVVRLYQTFFGRVPDQAGLNFQVDALRNGPGTIQNIAEGFAASQEFQDRFGGTTVNTAFINAVYQQVLGRTPSASEVQFYLDSGFSAARLALAFSESPEFVSNTESAVEQFLDAAGQQTADYTGPLGGNVNVGETFTLTTDIATVNGTGANDTFNGVIQTNGSTLQTGDVVNGGAGNDTLNILVASTPLDAPLAELNSVETVSIRALASTTLDATDWDGVTTLVNDRSTSQVNIEGVQNNATLVISNSASDLNVEFAEGALGADGTVSLSARGALSGADFEVTAGGSDTIKSVNLDVVTASTVGVDLSDTAEVLNISGAGSLKLSGFDVATLETVDASKNSGGVTLNLDGATELTTVTAGSGNDNVSLVGTGDITVNGGAGNDRFYFGASLTKDDVVNGGDGNDIVAVDGADFSSSTAVAGLNAVTNVETIEFVNQAGTTTITGATFKNTGVTELLFNTDGNDVVNNAGARLYSFGSANDGNATFNSTLGQTTLNLALKGDAAGGSAATVDTIAANGATTINIASSGGTTGGNTIGALTVATNSSIVITGAQDLAIGSVSAASSINGSAATGDLTITGSAASDIIVGGAGDDVLFGGDATVTTPASAQTEIYNIAGAIETGDKFSVDIDGTVITVSASNTSAADTVTALVTAINAQSGTTGVSAAADTGGTFTLTGKADGTAFVATGATTESDGTASDGQTIADVGGQAGQPAVSSPSFASDTLTGGAGNDTFKFIAGASLTQIDTITDLNLGTDVVGGRVDILQFDVTAGGPAATVRVLAPADQTAITSAATFAAAVDLALGTVRNEVVKFDYAGETYVALAGDTNGTFDAATDFVVKVTGAVGTLDASDISLI